ncbi:MAG: hypothetical protein UT50_C0003G0010 [Candidatus Moranbacteria bacterium GW2011_GWA2_39_41]|nr:MAG: hypothetical protein UT50_C0003G0010 [Candidatus Moranbacteria bacterium GW2011_GWA2_39_41]
MKNKYSLSIVILVLLIFPALTLAASFNYAPMEQIPGFTPENNFYSYISAVYKFGIWAVGVSALLMITIGGYMYIMSAANVASAEKAKAVITDAIIGLILALVSYLLLYEINPNLVKLRAPAVSPTASTAPGTPGVPADCKPNTKCAACIDCHQVTDLTCKETPCYLNSELIAKLKTVNSSASWRITEPWPPTVNHASSCHTNGTCADVNLIAGSGANINDVKILSDALKAAGFSSYTYESNNCAPFTAKGIPCKTYATMTSASFHVNK